MFGYIRPMTGELKVRELELYRSVYCGLCRSMKDKTGGLSRVSISYDFVFCAFVRAAVTGQTFSPEAGWCFLHPLSRRPMAKQTEALDACALMSAVLTREKAYDNYNDSRFIGKLGCALALPEANHMLKKAIQADPKVDETCKSVRKHLDSLYQLESSKCKSPDEAAQASGELLSDIFSYSLEGRQKSISSAVGLRVGRWVYLVDAADDYYSDLRTGSYNPFIEAGKAPDETLFEVLRLELGAARRALDLIDDMDDDVRAVTYNILCQGMTSPIEEMLTEHLKNGAEKARVNELNTSAAVDETKDNEDK